MTQMPPPPIEHDPGHMMAPHHGVLILVFGILSWLVCFIFGIVAWVMGNKDLQEIDAGRMDPEGRALTSAGKTCGMIAAIINFVILGLIFFLVILGTSVAVTNP